MSDFLSELESEAADMSAVPSDEGLARLRKAAEELVAAEADARRLERELKDKNKEVLELRHERVPSIMDEIGQDRIGLPNAGEYGADLVLEPYYKANIAADWEPEKKQAAFDHLEELGAADLLRSQLTVSAGAGDMEKMRRVRDRIRQILAEEDVEGGVVELSLGVPWNTLTSFVREWSERGHAEDEPVLQPDRIGATIGRVAKVKPRRAPKK